MADDMMTITRRTLMTAAAGIGTALSSRHLGDAAFAQSAARTRYNATSPRGRQMLNVVPFASSLATATVPPA